MALPVRTCVGCGGKEPQAGLVRLRVEGGLVVVDRERRGGRGAWLHPGEPCLDRAMKRKAFGRAFRAPSVRVDLAVLRLLLTGNARKD
ncbi:MAG: YlxR family protein [Anaeromyxobacteraceae bacterium]